MYWSENAGQIAAAFTGGDDRHIDRRERSPAPCSASDNSAPSRTRWRTSCKNRAQPGSGGALGEKIQSLQNRQAGLDQGIELLIENQEIIDDYFLRPVGSTQLRKNIEMHPH